MWKTLLLLKNNCLPSKVKVWFDKSNGLGHAPDLPGPLDPPDPLDEPDPERYLLQLGDSSLSTR